MKPSSYESDVVVVGGGFAGLASANRAAQHGLKVMLLERGTGPDYMCNSRVCTGVYHIAWKSETYGEQALYERIMSRSGGLARKDLAHLVSESAVTVKNWLVKEGATFEPHYSDPNGPEMLRPRRTLSAGLDWRDRGPDIVLRRLTDNLVRRNGEVHLGTAADALLMQDGKCIGVRGRKSGNVVHYLASAVVLADGGFQADPELVSKHISPYRQLRQRNAGTGKGDAIRMAEEAGAALVGLDKFYGHILSLDAFSNERLWPYPQLDMLASTSILVDGSGERFANEGLGGVFMTNMIAQLRDPRSACIVFDMEAWKAAEKEDTVPPNPSLVAAGGTLMQAETIEELANKLNMSPQILGGTVERYNAACSSGDFSGLAPDRHTDAYKPRPIQVPPFFAAPVCAGITFTTGGIAIDGKARVLRKDESVINGLLAAGSCTGGVEGGPKASYVGGIAKAFIFGYRAGETAAGK